MILAPALQGQLPPEMDEILEKLGVSLYRSPNDVEEFRDGKVDFIGLNVYCREYVTDWHGGELAVSANNKGGSSKKVEGKCIAPLFESARDSNVPRNKWGREILPGCMYSTIMDVHERYDAPRIFITENGHGAYEQPDADGMIHDDDRIELLGQFIEHMMRAKRDGARVRATTSGRRWICIAGSTATKTIRTCPYRLREQSGAHPQKELVLVPRPYLEVSGAGRLGERDEISGNVRNSPKGCWRQREHYIGNSLCDAPSHRRTRHLDHRSPARQIGRSALGAVVSGGQLQVIIGPNVTELTTTSSTSRESKSAVARLPTMPKPPKTLQKALKAVTPPWA